MNSNMESRARFERVFKVEKPIIAMIHLGDPKRDLTSSNAQDLVFSNAQIEIQTFYELGATAVLVENYFGSARDVERTLDWLRRVCPERIYGVNILGDVRRAFELAQKYGASFVQADSVCGHLEPERDVAFSDKLLNLRSEYEDVLLLGGVRFKYQPVRSGRSLEEDLEHGIRRCDAIVVTGEGTGMATEDDKIRRFREIIGDFPLIVGAGVTDRNCARQLSIADGAIIGSFFKKDGIAANCVEPSRVRAIMNVVDFVRKNVQR